jgi:large subunit ribosomal protein L25
VEIINLNVNLRQKKENNKSLRKHGFIPAVVYGKHIQPIIISLNSKDFYKTLSQHSTSSFINLVSEEKDVNGKTTVIKEIQKDPVKDNIIHVDFHEVSMNEKIEMEVAIHFIGKPEGVKLGGILEPLMRHITISGFPKDIVDVINLDVSSLKIGDIIHARDLKVGEGLEIIADKDAAIVTIAEPAVEEAVAQPVEETLLEVEQQDQAKTE